MSGSPIPNDWDGVTFDCYKVQWPSSQQWEAILLGQVSEPAFPGYWDANTGNPEDAADDVALAFDTTSPVEINIRTCDDMVSPAIAFSAVLSANQTNLPSGEYSKLNFTALQYGVGSHGFSIIRAEHEVLHPDLVGLWHYDILISTQSPVSGGSLRLAVADGPNIAIKQFLLGASGHLSIDVLFTEQLVVQASFNPTTDLTDVSSAGAFTRWSGHFLGQP